MNYPGYKGPTPPGADHGEPINIGDLEKDVKTRNEAWALWQVAEIEAEQQTREALKAARFI